MKTCEVPHEQLGRHASRCFGIGARSIDGGNNLANLEIPEDWKNWYGRILAYWHKMGCLVIDRKEPGYNAPWFHWEEAGFSRAEAAAICGGIDPVARGIRAYAPKSADGHSDPL
jgi:hypothetical protein